MIYRDPILDDKEIKLLQFLYKKASSFEKSKSMLGIGKKFGSQSITSLHLLIKSRYVGKVSATNLKGEVTDQVYITLKGKLLLYDIASRQQSIFFAIGAILISALVGFFAIYGVLLDYYGDKRWQAAQLEQLQMINVNLENLIKNKEDPE